MTRARIAEIIARLSFFRSHSPPDCLEAGHNLLRGKRILILAPHSDDETIGCYNACRSLPDAEIDIIVFGAHENDIRLTQERRVECENAIGLFVNSIHFMDLPDGKFSSCRHQIDSKLSELQSSYDFILAPAPNDLTPDHIPVSMAVKEIVPSGKVIYYRSTWLTFRASDASFYFSWPSIDKIDALRQFKSQSDIGFISAVIMATNRSSTLCYEYFQMADAENLLDAPVNSISLKSAILGVGVSN